MEKVCVFFGHRVVFDEEKVKLQLKRVTRELIEQGFNTFWLGGYGEFDALADDVTHELKQEFPHIRRVYVMAYLPTNKAEYHYKSQFYDEMFYPEGVEIGPKKFAITRRNKYMVENADIIVAYVHATTGGAALALKRAQRLNKKMITLNTN